MNTTRTVTIGQRLTWGFALVLIASLTAGSITCLKVTSIRSQVSDIVTNWTPGVIELVKVRPLVSGATQDFLENIATNDPAETKRLDREMVAHLDDAEAALRKYQADGNVTVSAGEQPYYDRALATLLAYKEKLLATRALVLALKHAEATAVYFSSARPAGQACAEALNAEIKFNQEHLLDSGAVGISLARSAFLIVCIGVALSILIGIVLAYGVTRGINRILMGVGHTLDESAAQVASAASQVSSSASSLASGASQQAASLEETSASLEEISSLSKRNSEAATEATDLSSRTRQAAEGGVANITEMKQAMDAIKDSSASIAKIVKTIDEIAFQTNILALNAAVEAARAGESGAGFAVVAEEVRNLAQRSAQSAKETAGQIEDSVARSEHGIQISAKVAESFEDIVDKARKVDHLVAEIATASKEQQQGIGQVATVVTQMDKVTQANAAGAEESASASEELSSQAKSMRESVDDLQRLVGAKSDGEGRAAKPGPSAPTSVPSRRVGAVPHLALKRPAPVAARSASPARRNEAAGELPAEAEEVFASAAG